MYEKVVGTEDNCCTGVPDEFYRPKKVKDKILNVHRLMDFMKTNDKNGFYYLNFGLFGKVSDLNV